MKELSRISKGTHKGILYEYKELYYIDFIVVPNTGVKSKYITEDFHNMEQIIHNLKVSSDAYDKKLLETNRLKKLNRIINEDLDIK